MNNIQEQIVKLARDFIQSFGYNSFSFKQIAEVLSIKNAAIHHYYPAKEDLGLAVIEKDSADFGSLMEAMENSSPTDRANSILDFYKAYFNDGRKLCMISTCGSIIEQFPAKMQTATREHLRTISLWLEDTFRQGLETKEFPFKGTQAEMSDRWTVNLPGALITGRIRGEESFKKNLLE